MMSLIVAVVRNSTAAVSAGFAAAAAGAAWWGAEHATATNTAPPATHNPQNVIGLIHTTSTLQDFRIAELAESDCRKYGGRRMGRPQSVISLDHCLQSCHSAILQRVLV